MISHLVYACSEKLKEQGRLGCFPSESQFSFVAVNCFGTQNLYICAFNPLEEKDARKAKDCGTIPEC